MNKFTTQNISDEVGRTIQDSSSVNVPAANRIDFINESIDDLLHIFTACHKKGFPAMQYPFARLDKDEFNYQNRITLPNDYHQWIDLRKEGDADPIKIMPVVDMDDSTSTAYGAIIASNVSAALPYASNADTDDLSLRGEYTGTEDLGYKVEIDGATTFRWSDDGGSTWDVSTVTITGEWQTLNNGIEIKFATATGRTTGDYHTFTGYVSRICHILELNYHPDTYDVILTYVKAQTRIAAIGSTTYLPWPEYYNVLKYLVEIRCRAYNEEKVDVTAAVNQVAMRKVREIIRERNAGQEQRVSPEGEDPDTWL